MTKYTNLVGQVFGRLTVIGRSEKQHGEGIFWDVRCSCGNIFSVLGYSLVYGRTQSCGCLQKEKASQSNYKNLVGQRFGRLVVIERVEDRSNLTYVRCLCDCGNITTVYAGSLRKGTTQSCGCLQKERISETHFKDLVGQRFGRLVVINRAKSVKETTFFECQCDCGRQTIVRSANLLRGITRSCGCLGNETRGKSQFIDITNQRFGKLVVVEFVEDLRKWRVICDCGNESLVTGGSLRSGHTTSCGCYKSEATSRRLTTHGLSKTKEYKNYKVRKRLEKESIQDSEWTFEMESALRDSYDCCVICGITEEEHREKYNQSLHVDHLYPLSKGFGLKPGNAVLLCQHCNCSKSNKDLDELPEEDQELLINAAEYFKNYWETNYESPEDSY